MKCPYINPTPDICLNCILTACDGGKSKDTAQKQKRHYYRHLDKMRKYHREYQRENYDTQKNTEMCRKYRNNNPEKKKQYDRERYLRIKAERQMVIN